MGDNNLNNEEFDHMLELIAAILFMAIGIIGIITMMRQFDVQTEINPRVDKVRVSSIDQEDKDPFWYTAYQAYMFAWMMDGHDKTALYYFRDTPTFISGLRGNPPSPDEGNMGAEGYGDVGKPTDGTGFPRSQSFIGLTPADYANGFLVLKGRAIIGSEEYAGAGGPENYGSGNVKSVIAGAYDHQAPKVVAGYTGESHNSANNGNFHGWHLQLMGDYVTNKTIEYTDEFEVDVFEERKDYLWSLHPCNRDSH